MGPSSFSQMGKQVSISTISTQPVDLRDLPGGQPHSHASSGREVLSGI